jgi:hypothetical protein
MFSGSDTAEQKRKLWLLTDKISTRRREGVGLEAVLRPTLEKMRELSELQTQCKLHSSHGHITFSASEAAQCCNFTG